MRIIFLMISLLLELLINNSSICSQPLGVGVSHTFSNPVIHEQSPDPGIYFHKVDGYYYVYNTFRKAFRSQDLVNWEPLGNVMAELPGNKSTTWAPEVFRREKDGFIYMLYTQDARLYIARALSPVGPFDHYTGPLLPDTWSIDPTYFIDDDGTEYIFWNTGGCDSTSGIWGGKLNDDLSRIIDPVHCLGAGTHPEKWITECVREAPAILKHNEVYYLVYSGNGTGANYGIAYATSLNAMGPWKLYAGNPIVWDGVSGPGHCSFTKSPDGKQLIVAYHQHSSGMRLTSVDKAGFTNKLGEIDLLKIDFTNKKPQPYLF